jgi:hypothetical protein
MAKRFPFIFVLLLLPLFAVSALAQDESPDDPGHKANASVGSTKYSVPKGFDLEKSSNPRLALLRAKDNVAIFLSFSTTRPDNSGLNDTASTVAALYLPAEKDFKWKPTGVDPEEASKFEVAGGSAKGLSKGNKLVQLYYKVIGIKGRYITLGYIMEFGEQTPSQSNFAFTLDGTAGTSASTWHAIAHIVASITAEPFQDIDDKLP